MDKMDANFLSLTFTLTAVVVSAMTVNWSKFRTTKLGSRSQANPMAIKYLGAFVGAGLAILALAFSYSGGALIESWFSNLITVFAFLVIVVSCLKPRRYWLVVDATLIVFTFIAGFIPPAFNGDWIGLWLITFFCAIAATLVLLLATWIIGWFIPLLRMLFGLFAHKRG